ncbi:MAG: response regulator [Burkholderiales bacterium]|nr:response regulator [Burkholderiales bacterium]
MLQHSLSALVADPSSTARLSMRAILQGFDMGRIDTASSVSEARRRLIENKYDVVLCEYHFESDESGQDLLEDLRARRILPVTTLFIMVTGESSYAKVMTVAEESPDEYMLKPVQAGNLAERIEKAFARREALMEVYEAINRQDYAAAIKICQRMMAIKTIFQTDIMRLASQSLFRLERFDEAAAMYKRILEIRNPAWAKLGLARVALKQGDKATAEQAMRDIIGQHLRYLPVYNQLTDLLLADERFADALDITEQAIKISPHSVKRLQRAGQLCYSLGQTDKAVEYFNRAVRINGSAVELDFRTLFHLALLQFARGQSAEGASLVKQLAAKRGDDEISEHGRVGGWYADLAAAVEAISRREPLAAIDALRRIAAAWDSPDFTFDFALDYLQVLNQLYADDIAGTLSDWLQPIVLRFATGRHAQELMTKPIAANAKLAEKVEHAGEDISHIANDAAQLMVESNFRAAADRLVKEGIRTRNNRLLAAAANAASKCFQVEHDEQYKQHAETCLAFMTPPDDNLTRRLRSAMAGVGNKPADA